MCIVHVLIFFAIAGGTDFASNRVLARPAFHVAFFLGGASIYCNQASLSVLITVFRVFEICLMSLVRNKNVFHSCGS